MLQEYLGLSQKCLNHNPMYKFLIFYFLQVSVLSMSDYSCATRDSEGCQSYSEEFSDVASFHKSKLEKNWTYCVEKDWTYFNGKAHEKNI
jgi:hypothetical protein